MRCELLFSELHVESQVELLSNSVWLRISQTKLLLEVKRKSCRITGCAGPGLVSIFNLSKSGIRLTVLQQADYDEIHIINL